MALGIGLAMLLGSPAPAQETGINPFAGTLEPATDLSLQLLQRYDGLRGQIQEVNQRLLQMEDSMARQTAQLREIAEITAVLGVGDTGGSPLLSRMAQLEQQEQREAAFTQVMQDARFVMCVNGERALFRDPDGNPFLVSLDTADENPSFRLLGGC